MIDTSAIITILQKEDGFERYFSSIQDHPEPLMASPTYLECSLVLRRRVGTPAAITRFDTMLRELGVTIVPFTPEEARLASQAYADFGKGTGHPAGLNFGDCAAYAAAVFRNRPLLWKGNDFTHTGIESALR